MRLFGLTVILGALTFACSLSSGLTTWAAEPRSVAGAAVDSIFNPHRAPAQKTMGLLQRSFLDLVESSEKDLQVALVIDGTDSMATDIEAVRGALRNMVSDLQQYKGDHVSFQIVVYRDTGAPSGEVVLPLKGFTSDVATLESAFEKIVPESGAPYFLELTDLGVHEALEKLDWSTDDDVTRWLLLFGDAPPYDADFVDTEDTGARRRFDTDLLVNIAQRKQVRISCVLCTSRPEDAEIYNQVLDRTRGFMNSLATGTGGLMLDLSYPDIQKALVEAAKKERVEQLRIGRITQGEVDAIRQAAEEQKVAVAPSQRMRFAVLPHVPLTEMTFDPDHPAVLIATELRQKLLLVPQAEAASSVDIDRQLRRLRAAKVPESEVLSTLAARLRVDYVVWGNYKQAQGIVRIDSAVYSKVDGAQLFAAKTHNSATLPETALAGDMLDQLIRTARGSNAAPEIIAAVDRMGPTANGPLIRPVSDSAPARSELLAGFEALEQALAYTIESEEGQTLLDRAEASLTKASADDPRNPFAHLLLASCSFNQAQRYQRAGNAQKGEAAVQNFSEALKRAYRERDNARFDYLKQEIEADYNLLIKKDHAAAIASYEALALSKADTKLNSGLRAHWMLAGILSGDWNVGDAIVDAPKAREHLLQILAIWPDSSEAQYIKRALRWNDEKGGNEFEHFPRENKMVLTSL